MIFKQSNFRRRCPIAQTYEIQAHAGGRLQRDGTDPKIGGEGTGAHSDAFTAPHQIHDSVDSVGTVQLAERDPVFPADLSERAVLHGIFQPCDERAALKIRVRERVVGGIPGGGRDENTLLF